MKLVPNLVPTELCKLNNFSIGLPTKYGPTVNLVTTLKVTIWARKVERKGSLKDLQDPTRKVDSRCLFPKTRGLGVIKKKSGVRSEKKSLRAMQRRCGLLQMWKAWSLC